nr:MAG TPA: head to tail adaptor [Caudoviricetes sp.]
MGMAYCADSEVFAAIKEEAYNVLLGEEYIEDVNERKKRLQPLVEEAIEDADAEIDGYLAKRYDVPMSPAPKVLNKFSKDIAVYNLMSRIGIDESNRDKTYLNRYNAAVKFLEGVAKGLIDIGTSDTGSSQNQAAQKGFRMEHSERLFSRETMKGY